MEVGPGVDRHGNPVIDPTRNVLDLVAAANLRQDDLRKAEFKRQDDLREAESSHIRQIQALMEKHASEMLSAEKARLDAIREVDVAAIQARAAESTAQATALAAQVSAAAEAMRTQVAATATLSQAALTSVVEPIRKDISELRDYQLRQAGAKAEIVETRTDQRGSNTTLLAVIGTVIALLVAGLSFYVALSA